MRISSFQMIRRLPAVYTSSGDTSGASLFHDWSKKHGHKKPGQKQIHLEHGVAKDFKVNL